MSNFQEKLEEAVKYHNNINQQLIEAEENVEQLKAAKQQLIGRIQTYRELIESDKVATGPMSQNGLGDVEHIEVVDAEPTSAQE